MFPDQDFLVGFLVLVLAAVVLAGAALAEVDFELGALLLAVAFTGALGEGVLGDTLLDFFDVAFATDLDFGAVSTGRAFTLALTVAGPDLNKSVSRSIAVLESCPSSGGG